MFSAISADFQQTWYHAINNTDANHDDLNININVMETDFETIGEDQFENETDEESLDEDHRWYEP